MADNRYSNRYDNDIAMLNAPLLAFVDGSGDGEGVAFRVIPVTPAEAEFVIRRRNGHNRKLRPLAKDAHVRDMESGNWHMNGETVKFDKEGGLLDGQHRMAALSEARVESVEFLVVRGLEPEAQETVDAGAARTIADAFRLRGETESTVLAAVVRKVWMWERGDYRFHGADKPTVSELSRLLAERPRIHRSAEIAVHTRRSFPLIPQSVIGVAHYVFSEIDADTAVWFFARLGDGAGIDKGHPVHTLRQRLIADKDGTSQRYADRYMIYQVRAWNAVREGKSLDKIIMPKDNKMVMPI